MRTIRRTQQNTRSSAPRSRPMGPLLAATVMVNMGFGGILALLAELQDGFDLPTWGLGVVIGSSFGIALATQLLLAGQADRGYSRELLLTGLVLSAVGLAWMGTFATTLVEFTVARALLSIGEGALLPAARRIVVLREPEAAGKQLGQLSSAAVAGFLFGSPVAALVAAQWGVRAPFLVMAVGCAVLVPSVRRVAVPEGPVIETTRGLMRQLARVPAIRAGIALTAAEYVSIGVFDSVWARYLTDLGAGPVYIGLSLALFAAPLAFLSPLGGRLADRHGAYRVGALALVATVPVHALYGLSDSIALLTGLVLIHTVFEAAAIPASQAAVAHASPAEAVASGQGLAQAIGLASAAVAALVAPIVYGAWGATWVYVGTAAVMAALVALASVITARSGAGAPTGAGFGPHVAPAA